VTAKRSQSSPARRFRKDLLPQPRTFYERELGEFRRQDSHGWAKPKAGCPFHPSKSKQSFSVNLRTGGFYCFGCQAKGGDIVAYVMKRDGLGFIDAAKALGAWDDAGGITRHRFTVPVRFLVLEFVIDGAAYRAEVRDNPKNDPQPRQAESYFAAEYWLYRIEEIYTDSNARLSELRQGASRAFPEEEETHWGILALAIDEVREAEAHFVQLRVRWPGAPHNHAAKAWRGQ
jgi:CHC2-type zinc finger protein